MGQEFSEQVIIEMTDDGLFMASLIGHASSYALGETEDEARENLLDRFRFDRECCADSDEYSYLYSAFN